MTKTFISIAAAAAMLTTTISAFDATRGDGLIMKETGAVTARIGSYLNGNVAQLPATIVKGVPGQLGDALIYPAFWSNNGFQTDFSVINTSSTEAIIVKVVLYSAKDSKELRDFNVYLSANDVFRATIKNGKIVSTDGSTIVSSQTTQQEDHDYNYLDSGVFASADTPFETTTNGEDVGYIAVYGMVQVDKANTAANVDARYHKKHENLWRDYRHLVDQCRGENARSSMAEIVGGMYVGGNVNIPNIDLASATVYAGTSDSCGVLTDTTMYGGDARPVAFKSPENILTGTLTVSGEDSRGTRSMALKPTPFTNFADGTNALLWSEGELASISDRCIQWGKGNVGNAAQDTAYYDATCVNDDALSTAISQTLYEFGSKESKLVVTQPWKRTLIQIDGDGATLPAAKLWSGKTWQTGTNVNGIVSGTDLKDYNVANYGAFAFAGRAVYNDDEDMYRPGTGSFIVSPANESTPENTIPNEVSVFDPISDKGSYESGYALLNYKPGMHGIVTQMIATEVGGTAEISWLYPFTK